MLTGAGSRSFWLGLALCGIATQVHPHRLTGIYDCRRLVTDRSDLAEETGGHAFARQRR